MRPFILMAVLLLGPVAAASAEPRLTLSKYQIYAGEVITLRASGFPADAKLVSHLFRPDGSEYPVMTFRADREGGLTHNITIVPIAFGTFEVRIEQEGTTTAASTRFMIVAPGWPAAEDTPQTTTVPEPLVGVWTGEVEPTQGSGAASPALVAITGGLVGTVVGTVAYPSRDCGGELWLVGMQGGAAQFGEVITYGIDRCTGDGVVTLTPPDAQGKVSLVWRDAGRKDGVVSATGTLTSRSR